MAEKKFKFNIIDFSVILVIIVAAIGFAVRFGLSQEKSINANTKFRYVLKIENVREFTADALKQSELVTDKKGMLDIAKIIDVEVEKTISSVSLSDGTLVRTEIPEKYNCIVTIEAQGNEFEDKYMLQDETELATGRTIELYTKYVQTSGTIKSIEVIE